MDFASMTNEALTAALAEAREKASALFALETPTIAQVDEAEALVASIGSIEAEQASRATEAKKAGERFAAARATFNAEDEAEAETEDEAETETEEAAEEAVEAAAGGKADDEEDTQDGGQDDAEEKKAMTASARKSQRISVAARVAKKTARPVVAETKDVVITAAADVPGFATGSELEGMDAVAKALTNRVKGFGKFNAQAAKQVNKQSGGEPVLNKFGVASFGLNFDAALTASNGNDYAAVQNATKGYTDEVMTAAGWCAPSEPVYSFLAGYVVDGLITLPEVNAPRGGLLITTGPTRDNNVDHSGFIQTEAQAIAGQVKTCETVLCPPFKEYRLDAIGHCLKIPLLTEKAYPELVTDALRYAGVLYAHKVNKYIIDHLVAMMNPVNFNGYGPSFSDTLEALSIIATKERRKFNLGKNAVLEVKIPQWVQEVFRADLSRRAFVAADSITDQQIDAHFTDRRLKVEYISDWQELQGTDAVLPGVFQAMMYPAGAFVKAVEDVINLSAVYDAASLSINQYTGVFFEQGIFVAQAGFEGVKVNIPVNTAGQMGALDLTGFGAFHVNGSF